MPTWFAPRRRSDDRHRIDRTRSAPGGLGRCCGGWRAIASIAARRAVYPRPAFASLVPRQLSDRPCGARFGRCAAHFEQDVERRAHRLSPIGQTVLDLGRHLRVDGAADHAVALQFAQLLGQHLRGRGGDGLLQLRKAQDAARKEMEDDHHLPAPFQNTERAFDSARRHVGRDVFKLTRR